MNDLLMMGEPTPGTHPSYFLLGVFALIAAVAILVVLFLAGLFLRAWARPFPDQEPFDPGLSRGAKLDQIENSWRLSNGLPQVNWDAIEVWMESRARGAEAEFLWTELAREWLQLLGKGLGGGYSIGESDHFLLLSAEDDDDSRRFLRWCEHYREEILFHAAAVADAGCPGKIVAIAFADAESLQRFVESKQEDERRRSKIEGPTRTRYLQMEWVTHPPESVESAIVSELTRAFVGHLPLPRWLFEGLTQLIAASAITGQQLPHTFVDPKGTRQYFEEQTIGAFWSGESFDTPLHEQRISFDLAYALVRGLLIDHPEKLAEFVLNASREDAGEKAMRVVCGETLAERVEQFLGPGEWGA